MNQAELKDAVELYSRQWQEADDTTKKVLNKVVDQMSPLISSEFYQGVFCGLLLPLQSLRGFYEAMGPEKQSLYIMVLRAVANRINLEET